MNRFCAMAAMPMALAMGAPASAITISFDDLPIGTVLSNQYAGVTFTPNVLSGSGAPTGSWATNTGLRIVLSNGSDVGGLGPPSLVSGNLVRSFGDWFNENGDASLAIAFDNAVASFSLDFAGIDESSSSRIFVYDGANLLTTLAAPITGQYRFAYAAPSITRLVLTPGDYNDWVGFDNLTYTLASSAVPEPATWAMMLAGFGTIGAAMRRRRPAVRFA